jgi:hypothetical protein
MENDPLRKDETNFPSKCVDYSPPPSFKDMDYVDTAIGEFSTACVAKKKEIKKFVRVFMY